MKLLIFPGAGNPDSGRYSMVYSLLAERASDFGYTAVDTSLRWPGQFREKDVKEVVLTPQGAVEVAQSKLAEYEIASEPYDILARSFGAHIALKSTLNITATHLRRIVLWGSLPYWLMWEAYVHDLENTKDMALAKGVQVDRNLFHSLEPIEWLLQQTKRKVIIAAGTEDPYSTPAFHSYLSQIFIGEHKNILFKPPVRGASHEVTADLSSEIVQDYLKCVLG
jgi:hypothetical protein